MDLPSPPATGAGPIPPPPSAGGIGVEFAAPEPDLSAAVALPVPGVPAERPPTPPPSASEPEPGDASRLGPGLTFGGYLLEEKIGQGGMGEVYRGRQVSLDRVVAIKILSKALNDNREFIERFKREARSVARITHPNIVGVYDFGQADGLWYMVCEFIEGSSMAKMIAERLVLPPAEVATLMVQCLAGLAHVGAQGIIHRDIKPDNILVTRDGIAKIADFGLAKDLGRKDDNTDLTQAGLAMGTPAYMSPEQCMGQRLDGRSDIYSLGVTAYFALTGQKPFTGASSFEVMTKQRELIPPAPHQAAPSVPRELSDVVMRMLGKRADERYDDAEGCRQAWLAAGTAAGFFGRSSQLDPAVRHGTVELPALVPIPSAAPTPAPASDPQIPTARPAAASVRRSSPDITASPGPRPATESARTSSGLRTVPSDRHHPTPAVASTSAAGSERVRRPQVDAAPCPQCGHLNRGDAAQCGRCGHALREADPALLAQQEAEAQRLFEVKRFSEAASIWSRLADHEGDRRSRSVLRSKEREAKRREHEAKVADFRQRAQGHQARGDLKSALILLEQATATQREAGGAADPALDAEVSLVRRRIAWARRMRGFLIAIAVLVVIAATIAAVLVLNRGGTPAAPPPAGPSTPPAEGPG